MRLIEYAETEPSGTHLPQLQALLRQVLEALHEFGEPVTPNYWRLAGAAEPAADRAQARRSPQSP